MVHEERIAWGESEIILANIGPMIPPTYGRNFGEAASGWNVFVGGPGFRSTDVDPEDSLFLVA